MTLLMIGWCMDLPWCTRMVSSGVVLPRTFARTATGCMVRCTASHHWRAHFVCIRHVISRPQCPPLSCGPVLFSQCIAHKARMRLVLLGAVCA